MKEPVTRTWLIIGTFAAPGLANCREDDHERIRRAFDLRAGQAAADLMAEHLRVIEEGLQPGNTTGGAVDVVDLFKRTSRALACSTRPGRTRHRPCWMTTKEQDQAVTHG